MNKAYFARKAVDIDELKCRTGEERDKVPYVVEKVIELSAEKYSEVCNSLLSDYDFIEDVKNLMYVDPNVVWHVVLIKAIGGVEAIITNVEGYSYLRYCSYISDCRELLGQTENPLTECIREQIMEIRNQSRFNMFDTVGVQREAYDKGFYELVNFIQDYKKEYANYILTGRVE